MCFSLPPRRALLPKGAMEQQRASARLESRAKSQGLSGLASVLPAGAWRAGHPPGCKSHWTH